MKRKRVAKSIRQRVAEAAGFRCGYCLTSQEVIGPLLEIDHLVPEVLGGTSDESNLWLACPHCNGAKGVRIEAPDPQSGRMVPLFNPRTDVWSAHFVWADGGALIEGITPIGRATVAALKMNHPDIVSARRLWIDVGWHPPLS
jgi:hypothetical protein